MLITTTDDKLDIYCNFNLQAIKPKQPDRSSMVIDLTDDNDSSRSDSPVANGQNGRKVRSEQLFQKCKFIILFRRGAFNVHNIPSDQWKQTQMLLGYSYGTVSSSVIILCIHWWNVNLLSISCETHHVFFLQRVILNAHSPLVNSPRLPPNQTNAPQQRNSPILSNAVNLAQQQAKIAMQQAKMQNNGRNNGAQQTGQPARLVKLPNLSLTSRL